MTFEIEICLHPYTMVMKRILFRDTHTSENITFKISTLVSRHDLIVSLEDSVFLFSAVSTPKKIAFTLEITVMYKQQLCTMLAPCFHTEYEGTFLSSKIKGV